VSHPHHAHHPSEVPGSQRVVAALTHAAGIFFVFIPSFIVWWRTRDEPEDSWLAHQAKEALNFQYSMTAIYVVCGMLGFTLSGIGLRILPFAFAFDVIFALVATLQSARGARFEYPLKFRFVR
jgi:uncharacterized protein